MKPVASKFLLGLLIGAAVGGAITYLATSDKKEEWLKDLTDLAGKAKEGFNEALALAKSKCCSAPEVAAGPETSSTDV